MKKISVKTLAKALYEAVRNQSEPEAKKSVARFAEILRSRRLLKSADAVAAELYKLEKKDKGIKTINVTSSRKISEAARKDLKKIFGNTVEIEENIDPEVIGGMVLQVGDMVWDGSLRNQLVKLKNKIAES